MKNTTENAAQILWCEQNSDPRSFELIAMEARYQACFIASPTNSSELAL
jgi:hypothetical protein